MTGWWFGTSILFSHVLGFDYHPNWCSHFSEGWPWPTNQRIPFFSENSTTANWREALLDRSMAHFAHFTAMLRAILVVCFHVPRFLSVVLRSSSRTFPPGSHCPWENHQGLKTSGKGMIFGHDGTPRKEFFFCTSERMSSTSLVSNFHASLVSSSKIYILWCQC